MEKLGPLLKYADKNSHAVAAFNAFNYESIAWIIETAEEENTPAIIMMYPGVSEFMPISTFAAVATDLAGIKPDIKEILRRKIRLLKP